MEKELRKQAYELISQFQTSFNEMPRLAGYDAEVKELIVDTLKNLEHPKASYKNSDYAIARFYARISKLIGFGSIEISEQTKQDWRAFNHFFYSDALNDVRAVGGPLLS